MPGQASVSVAELACERFLYAPVCEQHNGTQVTVLSALVRANIDPWDEAARLARMPRAKAEATLSSILRRSLDRNWTGPEVGTVSARLIRLLPTNGGGDLARSVSTAIGEMDR